MGHLPTADRPRTPEAEVRAAGLILRIISRNDVPSKALDGQPSPWGVLGKYLAKRPQDLRESSLAQWLNGQQPADGARLRAALVEADRLGLHQIAAQEDAQGEADADEVPVEEWPAPPAPEAFRGVLGDLVRKIEPHSEADPIALLAQSLIMFGSVIGRTAHYVAEADRHYGNEFLGLVGTSAKGRKGSSYGHVRRVFESVDPGWTGSRITSGLSSGEGLIWAVRDPIPGKDDGAPDNTASAHQTHGRDRT